MSLDFIGPIGSTVPLLIATEYNDFIYILCQDQDSNLSFVSTLDIYNGSNTFQTAYFYFSPISSNPLDKSKNVMPCKFINSLNSLSYDGTKVKSEVIASTLELQGSTFSFWDNQSVLTGISYDLYSQQYKKYVDIGINGATGINTHSIYIIPIMSYYQCDGKNNQQSMPAKFTGADITSQGIPYTIQQLLCRSKGYTGKGDLDCVPLLWSDLNYCNANNALPYCSKGSYCGSNCAGPCPQSADTCLPDGSQNVKCDHNIFKGEWWKSTWFIISVSVIAAIIFIIILVIIIRVSKKKKANKGESKKNKNVVNSNPSKAV